MATVFDEKRTEQIAREQGTGNTGLLMFYPEPEYLENNSEQPMPYAGYGRVSKSRAILRKLGIGVLVLIGLGEAVMMLNLQSKFTIPLTGASDLILFQVHTPTAANIPALLLTPSLTPSPTNSLPVPTPFAAPTPSTAPTVMPQPPKAAPVNAGSASGQSNPAVAPTAVPVIRAEPSPDPSPDPAATSNHAPDPLQSSNTDKGKDNNAHGRGGKGHQGNDSNHGNNSHQGNGSNNGKGHGK